MSQQILVLDCHAHTLTVMRSLSAAGYQTTLGVTKEELDQGFVHASRFVTTTWQHPDIIDEPGAFDAALLSFLGQNPQYKLIFPVGENSVRKLADIRDEIPGDIVIAMPDNDAVNTCLHKPSAYQVAEKCQIPTPGTKTIISKEELRTAVNELGFPSIVKASDSTSLLLGKKCVFVRSQADLKELADNWPGGEEKFVVQNEIRGKRFNCDIVAEKGQLRLYFESEILRTDQPDYAGNSVYDRSIAPNPVHRKYCEQLVNELNYTGVALIQFLNDEKTGNSYFIEANPRAGSTVALPVHCGMDLPSECVRACTGGSSRVDQSYPVGQSQNWLHGDLLGLRKARMNREVSIMGSLLWIAQAFADFLRADCHTTFVWKDPKPTMLLYWHLLARIFFKQARGSARKAHDST